MQQQYQQIDTIPLSICQNKSRFIKRYVSRNRINKYFNNDIIKTFKYNNQFIDFCNNTCLLKNNNINIDVSEIENIHTFKITNGNGNKHWGQKLFPFNLNMIYQTKNKKWYYLSLKYFEFGFLSKNIMRYTMSQFYYKNFSKVAKFIKNLNIIDPNISVFLYFEQCFVHNEIDINTIHNEPIYNRIVPEFFWNCYNQDENKLLFKYQGIHIYESFALHNIINEPILDMFDLIMKQKFHTDFDPINTELTSTIQNDFDSYSDVGSTNSDVSDDIENTIIISENEEDKKKEKKIIQVDNNFIFSKLIELINNGDNSYEYNDLIIKVATNNIRFHDIDITKVKFFSPYTTEIHSRYGLQRNSITFILMPNGNVILYEAYYDDTTCAGKQILIKIKCRETLKLMWLINHFGKCKLIKSHYASIDGNINEWKYNEELNYSNNDKIFIYQ